VGVPDGGIESTTETVQSTSSGSRARREMKKTYYDYFGARYYDAKIGRWGQVEPLLDKYPSLTPYNYSVNNSLRVIDPNGADPFEIIVRTYIPFYVVAPGFRGDSRGPDPNSNSFRTEQRITVETDRSVSSTIITNYDAKISPSTLIAPSSPVPIILTGMGEGEFHALVGYSSELNGGNNASVELTGEAHVGVIPTALSPAIDYTFGITILPQKDGSVQVQLTGSHDKFPAYEIYIKDKSGNFTPIYNQSPEDPIFGPRHLFPYPVGGKTNVSSELILP
jgi:RHS repeat-associated protein